uniref:Uncharacterized protein n=1 Tax=Brassica oleracea TaxID=3712 RepID=A0A3P6DR95_BRAOL|nr:unnamed protein product [Brassica oleracea]
METQPFFITISLLAHSFLYSLPPLPLVISVVYRSGDWFALPSLAHHKVVPFTGEQHDRRGYHHKTVVFITGIASYHQNHRRHHRKEQSCHKRPPLMLHWEICNGNESSQRGDDAKPPRYDTSGVILHHHQW